ncbi:MAG: hypothetical protein Q7T11_06460 [Deltaproteobacteria bacterium]|nr:hypothetical protein [Deltaproteobacteria bacterium]
MGDVQLTSDQFNRLETPGQVSYVFDIIGELCEGISNEREPVCLDKAAQVSPLIKSLPVSLQGTVLTGLTRNQRVVLFKMLLKGKKPSERADLVLSLPLKAVPDLLLSLEATEGKAILDTISQSDSSRSNQLMRVLSQALSGQDEYYGKSRQLSASSVSNEALMIEMRGTDYESDAAVEVTVRKEAADRTGNGIKLSAAKKDYSELAVENFSNLQSWAVSGVMTGKDGKKMAFRYVARPQSVYQELWIDGRLIFPTTGQDRFFHDQVFAWARAGLKKAPAQNPLPADFGFLVFHRADEGYPEEKVFKVRKGQTLAQAMANPYHEKVKAKKPTWQFFYEGTGQHLLLITWNEVTDRLVYQMYTNHTEVPPALTLDANTAAAFLNLLPFTPGPQADPLDAPPLKRFESRLHALAQYR